MNEEDVCTVIKHPLSIIGSDGWALAPYGVLGQTKTHPRSCGTYPRILGRYVREKKVLTIENAIRKMTSLPAQKLGLRDRGVLREGLWADVVLFDPRKVVDEAPYEDPHRYPEGIPYVLVNGKIVVDEGELTSALSGKVLHLSNGECGGSLSTRLGN